LRRDGVVIDGLDDDVADASWGQALALGGHGQEKRKSGLMGRGGENLIITL